MKFYYENNMGDAGYFTETSIAKAIYTAWNIEATLWYKDKVIFAPYESNEDNNIMLKNFGLQIVDSDGKREVFNKNLNKITKYHWSEVQQLV